MSVPRRVSDIIQNHVKLEVESIDRMYLNVYQPKLQVAKGVANFFRYHRGNPIPSSALMQPISQAFITSLEKYAADRSIRSPLEKRGWRMREGSNIVICCVGIGLVRSIAAEWCYSTWRLHGGFGVGRCAIKRLPGIPQECLSYR
jgi:hypothetical protein